MKLVIYWYLLYPLLGISARLCGFPGQPENGDFSPRKEFYKEGEHVTYTCAKGYYFKEGEKYVKQDRRFCQCKGVWNGTVPTCNLLDLVKSQNPIAASGGINLGKISDENDITCGSIAFTINRTKIELTVDLLNVSSQQVNFTMLVGDIENDHGNINMKVEIQESKTDWQPCVASISVSSHRAFNFFYDKKKTSTTQMKITFYLPEAQQKVTKISICSLQAIAMTDTKCGQPEKPFHGEADLQSDSSRNQKALYKCDNGYRLVGENLSSCTTNGNAYYWQSNKPPICISERDKECKTVTTIQNGHLIISRPDCEEDYSFKELHNTASLQCEPDYTPQTTKRVAYCNEFTNWTWSFDESGSNLISGAECILTAKQVPQLLYGFLDERIILGIAGLAILVILIGFIYCCCRCCQKKPDSSVTRRTETAGTTSTARGCSNARSSIYSKFVGRSSTIQSYMGDNTYAELDAIAPTTTTNVTRPRKNVRIAENTTSSIATPSVRYSSSVDVVYASVTDSISPKPGKEKCKSSNPATNPPTIDSDEPVYNEVYDKISQRP